jgi:addiction module RelE/StbE family toxin
MRTEWLRKAIENLEQEARYIATENPQAARLVVARVLAAIALLQDQPHLGRPGRIHGTRELAVPKTPYLVPYRVTRTSVQILRVFHTSRRTPERW